MKMWGTAPNEVTSSAKEGKMTNAEKIKTLSEAVENLPAERIEFAKSLIAQFKKKGSLSDKQWYWIGKLTDMASPTKVPDFTALPESVGSMSGLIALFDKAKKHLKYPSLSLCVSSDLTVRLSLAGASSKVHGSVHVAEDKPYGVRDYYGSVSPDGVWKKSQKVIGNHDLDWIIGRLLRNISRDPAGVAFEHGKMTGRCCFCGKKLEDEKSTAVGYGPVCAKNWNLPYGVSVTET